MRLREVGCPPHLAGLVSLEDWRCSYLCSGLIPSVAERSTLFVKELSFPQTAPTDDAFSTGIGLEHVGIVGPVRWLWALDSSAKTRDKKGSAGARPLPLQCLSQFFPGKEKINCLGNGVLVHKSAYLSPMGWPGIYSICFSQLDGDKDSLLLDGGFSFLIAVRLIRDNWKAVIGNYPTSLIGEIWFDL